MDRPNATEPLIGFDARQHLQAAAEKWDGARRELFLLRPSAQNPLSVDPQVWPSIFRGSELDSGSGPASLVSRPEWVGSVQDLWDNLESLHGWLAKSPPVLAYETIAISLIVSVLSKSEWEAWHRAGCASGLRNRGVSPAFINGRGRFLGYDVADGYLTSGHTNCSYQSNEVQSFRREFGGGLNESHLFTDTQWANRFRLACDQRLPLHAPFFLYGLWAL